MALQDSSVLGSLVVDLGLLALFITQHSLLAWSPVKQALQSVLGALNRTAYCFTTVLALQVQQHNYNLIHYIVIVLHFARVHLLSRVTVEHVSGFILDVVSLHHSIILISPVLDLDALLAACDWRPLSVVSASCTLEYLVPSALLQSALPLLGNHLQHPHDLWLLWTAGHQAGNLSVLHLKKKIKWAFCLYMTVEKWKQTKREVVFFL